MAKKMRNGIAAELAVAAELVRRELEVYLPVVDDVGVDMVARRTGGRVRNLQVKSGESFSAIRGKVAHLAADPDAILVMVTPSDMVFATAADIKCHFPGGSGEWGDVFLNSAVIQALSAAGKAGFDNLAAEIG